MPLELPARREPVAFDQLMEGLLLHAMKERLDTPFVRRLGELGVDVAQPLRSAYPLSVLLDTVQLCADVLYPELPRDEAWFRVGRKALEGFGATVMGRALFGMARTWGPRRMLGHMTRVFQTGINYARARSVELPGGDVEVTTELLPEFHAVRSAREGLDPHFVRGIIEQMVEVCGVRVPVTLRSPASPPALGYTYRVSLSQAQTPRAS